MDNAFTIIVGICFLGLIIALIWGGMDPKEKKV